MKDLGLAGINNHNASYFTIREYNQDKVIQDGFSLTTLLLWLQG
jgi:hypothetical protein